MKNVPGLRVLIAKVIVSEGCGCCEATDHDALKDELARKLLIPKFSDGSGYDWHRVARAKTRTRKG